MLRLLPTTLVVLLASCRAVIGPPVDLGRHLAAAPADASCRLALDRGRLVAATVPIGQDSVPPAVRTAFAAVCGGGAVTFRGREWGPRGEGYRCETSHDSPAPGHVRSALVDADGRVLERAHSVPLADVPPRVGAAAREVGATIERALIVAGERREECWRCRVRDGAGRTFVVTIGLDGVRTAVTQLVAARVDVAAQGIGIGRKSIASTEAR